MLDHGLLPDPDRPYRTTWKDFLKSHWESLAATDFFSVEAWGPKGLTRYLVLFVIEVATRKVEIVGIHENPSEVQMMQWARNLTDPEDGFLKGKRVLIHDRDPLYTKKFRETLQAAGVRPLKLPKQSPDLNSVAESFVRNITRECLNRMIFFGERHVRYVVSSYVEHYLTERPHQGLDNRRIAEPAEPGPTEGPVLCSERLGGLLRSYYRRAA
jgi:transposase InsO family protein